MSVILLVGINAKFIHTNLAIRSLKANAKEYTDIVECVEYTINQSCEEILQSIYEKKPDVIGFSCYLWNIEYVLSISRDLKKIMPDVFIMAGGPEVSFRPEEILTNHPWINLIMTGEGENTFYEFAGELSRAGSPWQISLEGIAGIVYHREKTESVSSENLSSLVRTPLRELMPLDNLVFPYRDEDVPAFAHRIFYYESMRGCPFSCSYCLSSVDKSVRMKSREKTEREIDFFLRHRVPQVKFTDRTFNCNREYAYYIWKYIGDHDNGVTNFHFEISGDLLRDEDIALLAGFRAGLVQFEIGVQSTNEKTIQAIHRTMDLQRLRSNVQRIHKSGNIHQHLDLIAGLPYEDVDSFAQSFNDVYAMQPDQLQLGFLKILAGSYMSEAAGSYHMKYGSRPPYEVLSTRWLSFDDICGLKQIEEMTECYYNSFQFTATMAYLVRFFDTPFDMYRKLGEYYKEKGLFARKHSRVQRYEILWAFTEERVGLDEEQLEAAREVMTYDLFRRDYVKNPPAFVQLRDDGRKKEIRAFFDSQCENSSVLCGYEGFATKQLFHMIYMNRFTIHMKLLVEEGILEVGPPRYLLFDYQKRNPLNHSADVLEVPEDYFL